jgi:hypothetical protein
MSPAPAMKTIVERNRTGSLRLWGLNADVLGTAKLGKPVADAFCAHVVLTAQVFQQRTSVR